MRASARNRARREGYVAGRAWSASTPIPRCPYTSRPLARVWFAAMIRGNEARFADVVARIMQPIADAFARASEAAARSAFAVFATGDWLTAMGECLYDESRRGDDDAAYRARIIGRYHGAGSFEIGVDEARTILDAVTTDPLQGRAITVTPYRDAAEADAAQCYDGTKV